MTPKDKKIIEDSEAKGIPIFVLTAKDSNSIAPLLAYFSKCIDTCDRKHSKGILDRMREFLQWQEDHYKDVKLPD